MFVGGDDSRTDEEDSATDRLWILGGVAALAAVGWFKRDSLLAALAPYGLTAPNRVPEYRDSSRPWDPTGWHVVPGHTVTSAGWAAVTVLFVGLIGLLMCAAAAAAWVRWHRRGGIEAVPAVPSAAAAAAVAPVGFAAAVIVMPGRWVVAVLAAAVLAAAAGWWTLAFAHRYRTVAAFAAQADQVLGHGYPAAGRVQARTWQRDNGGHYPATITATCGPGWQDGPGELAQLGRYARAVGWPGYTWSYDPMRKQVTGRVQTAAGGHR